MQNNLTHFRFRRIEYLRGTIALEVFFISNIKIIFLLEIFLSCIYYANKVNTRIYFKMFFTYLYEALRLHY